LKIIDRRKLIDELYREKMQKIHVLGILRSIFSENFNKSRCHPEHCRIGLGNMFHQLNDNGILEVKAAARLIRSTNLSYRVAFFLYFSHMKRIAIVLFAFTWMAESRLCAQHTSVSWEKKILSAEGPYITLHKPESEDFFSHVQHLEAPPPGGEGFRAYLQQLKDSINQLPRRTDRKRGTAEQIPEPILHRQFEGNSYNGSAPNDNHIAISRNNLIISVINTNIFTYDLNEDSLLSVQSLQQFCAPLGLPDVKYDPRVLYDPDEDRFILVILNGFTWQTSWIAVAFSRSSNPAADGWNLYALNGNPLDNETWSDYPHLAVSGSDLFITVNTFLNGSFNNSGYVESTFWQLDKMAGYRGDSGLTAAYFHQLRYQPDGADTMKPIFNFTPIKGGSGHYGEKMFLLSNENLAPESNRYFLTIVNGGAASSNLKMVEMRSSQSYGLPPDARQMQNHRFDCVDARIQDGFFENNILHFVHNTITPLNGAGFVYGRIYFPEFEHRSIDIAHYYHDSLDFGFPAISYTGRNALENDAIITFNHCGREYPSGMSACYVDHEGRLSEREEVERGAGYVDVLGIGVQRFYERWGDYSGSQRLYQTPGWVIGAGYGSKANRRPETRIALLSSPHWQSGPPSVDFARDFKLYPNPAQRFFEVEFILDEPQKLRFVLTTAAHAKGGSIDLHAAQVRRGANRYSFNTTPLRNGVYNLLIINENGELIKRTKVVVAN
jgi:hypothetical protein